MKRISAPEQTREQLWALIEGRLGTAPDRSSLLLLAARLILEKALEGEVRDRIGRERYRRADGEAEGYRNGYRHGRMKTAEGTFEFAAPQVRDTSEPLREPGESDRSHKGSRGFGGRALCARAVDPGHRGCVYGRKRTSAALARGSERDGASFATSRRLALVSNFQTRPSSPLNSI